jgi:hypothetical protein
LNDGAVRGAGRILDQIRSDRDRVAATVAAIRKELADRREAATGRVRIDGPQGLLVERSEVLTPYVLETVYADAWRVGPGGQLTIACEPGTSDEQIERVRARFKAIERRGVTVHVTRRVEAARRDA